MLDFIKYLFRKKHPDYHWFEVIWCRWNSHPRGVVWYGNGDEPDMTCKGCGDNLR